MTSHSRLWNKLISKMGISLVLMSVVLLVLVPALCQTYPYCATGCDSSNIRVLGFTLNTTGECDDGYATATLNATIDVNTNQGNCVYVVFDYYTENNPIPIQVIKNFTDNTPFDTQGVKSVPVYSINWLCGENLYVENVCIFWQTGGPQDKVCNWGSCTGYVPAQCNCFGAFEVIIPGIRVAKVVDNNSINCTCQDTNFRFDITNTTTEYSDDWTFDCEGGDHNFAGLVKDKIYTVTETVPEGWIVTDISFMSSLGTSPPAGYWTKNLAEATATIRLREDERVTVTFTDTKCAWSDAGPNKITCAGDNVTLTGNAICFTSAGWQMDPSCKGSLIPSLDGDYNKSKYSPQNPLEADGISCKLYFNATGACGVSSDNTTVYVVEEPEAEIRVS